MAAIPRTYSSFVLSHCAYVVYTLVEDVNCIQFLERRLVYFISTPLLKYTGNRKKQAGSKTIKVDIYTKATGTHDIIMVLPSTIIYVPCGAVVYSTITEQYQG